MTLTRTRTLPNFFVVGAAKSGTSSLSDYLGQHPDVFMSPLKEPNYFALRGGMPPLLGPRADLIQRVETFDDYTGLFLGVRGERAIGEASTYYLYLPEVAEAIFRQIAEARIIVLLRDPVDRAHSQYLMNVMLDREPLTRFEDALDAEDRRVEAGWAPDWHYTRLGAYFSQVKRYLDLFGRERVKVCLYEDLLADAARMTRDLYGFLEVDTGFLPDVSVRHGVSRVPRSRVLHRWLMNPAPLKRALRRILPAPAARALRGAARALNTAGRRPLARSTRRRLVDVFRPDIIRLENLIERDLSPWLET